MKVTLLGNTIITTDGFDCGTDAPSIVFWRIIMSKDTKTTLSEYFSLLMQGKFFQYEFNGWLKQKGFQSSTATTVSMYRLETHYKTLAVCMIVFAVVWTNLTDISEQDRAWITGVLVGSSFVASVLWLFSHIQMRGFKRNLNEFEQDMLDIKSHFGHDANFENLPERYDATMAEIAREILLMEAGERSKEQSKNTSNLRALMLAKDEFVDKFGRYSKPWQTHFSAAFRRLADEQEKKGQQEQERRTAEGSTTSSDVLLKGTKILDCGCEE